ncbi:hypothetical protein EDC04DRAFT_2896568 [Pisolithus marmoratus]|nr:hypothetical protein EDC04DRAFT_2896568 [Pisolithus marmoratus]
MNFFWSTVLEYYKTVHEDNVALRVMLVIEHATANDGRQVIFSSGGVATDSIIVVRAREHHEHWQSTGQNPVCRVDFGSTDPLPASWTSLSLQAPHLPLLSITICALDSVTGMVLPLLKEVAFSVP